MFNTRFVSRHVLCVCLLLTALITGCGGGSSSTSTSSANNGLITLSTRTYNNLQFTLSTTKTTFSRGEQVPLTFTVKNVGSQVINGTNGQCLTLLQVTQGGQVIGPAPAGCGAGVSAFTINPGGTTTFTSTWNQENTQAQQVQPGAYALKVWFAGSIDGSAQTADQAESNLFATIQIAISS